MTASAPQSLPDWIRDSLTGPMTARPSAPMGSAAKPALPLEGLFADLAQAAWERLPETICQHADWQASAHADVQTALVKRLGDLFRPVLSENLTVCRQAWTAHNVSGDLDALWLQAMRGTSWTKSGWAKLFALRLEMPRLLHLVLSQWQGAVIDLVTAYGADRSALADALCGGVDPGPCIGLTWGLSDPHGHGRGVALLSLRDYPDGLVYKPRPMALDAAMAGVIGLLNGDPNAPTHLKMPAVLDRGAYGWAERIQPRPCNGSEDIPLFYRRAGALLALLHSLRATDFHAENIIAEAATPVSVDLETLWHPLLSGVQTGDAARGASGELDSKVRRAISRSLPATHYLSVAWNKAPDAGGVGGLDGLKTNELVENGVSGTHLPRLADGQIIDPSDHVDTILEGFRAYSAFLAAHPALAPAPEDPDGPPQALRGLPARMLVRHTGSYLARLDEISRPLALVSPEAFGTALAAPFPDRAFDPTAPAAPALWQAEQKALRRMDVPAFYWRIGQPDAGIREADGTAIPELTPMVETGRSGPGDRLDPEGAARVARAVLSLRFEKPITNLGGPALTSGPAASLDPAAALEAAEQIGAALEAVALRSGSGSEARADWVGIILRGKGADVGMPELELYTGLPGVLWFLSALAQRTGASRWQDLLNAGLRRLEDRLQPQKSNPIMGSLGAFNGAPGLAWALLVITQDSAHGAGLIETDVAARWRRWALDLLLHLPAAAVAHDRDQDLIGGTPGAILVLLHAANQTPDRARALRAKACELGEAFLAARRDHGLWSRPDGPVLTGLSHGMAGVALAFAQLHAVDPRPEFAAAKDACLAFERAQFNQKAPGWPDLRSMGDNAAPSYPAQWCHGAGGIALSRLALSALDPGDDLLHREAVIGADLTAALLPGHVDDLCCGTAGRSLILLHAAKMLESPQYEVAGRQALGWLRALAAQNGAYRLQFGQVGEAPGLMKGVSGLGLAFLSFAQPIEPIALPLLPGILTPTPSAS